MGLFNKEDIERAFQQCVDLENRANRLEDENETLNMEIIQLQNMSDRWIRRNEVLETRLQKIRDIVR